MAFVKPRSTWAFCVCVCLASLTPAIALSDSSSNSRAAFPQDAYFDVKCTSEVTDLGRSPVNRWGAAKADLALSAINRHWNQQLGSQGSDVTLNYVNSMMNFLGMSEQNCGLVSDSCDFSSLSCMDQSMANPSPKTPAHWLILRSLSNFHSFHLNFYNSMTNAQSSITNIMGSFVSTFAPGAPEPQLIDIALKGFLKASTDFAIGQILGGVGNGLTGLSDEAKEGVTAAVEGVYDWGSGLAEEGGQLPPDLTPEQKKGSLVDTLQGIVQLQSEIISGYTERMLSGHTGDLDEFSKQIRSANWVFDSLRDNVFNAEIAIQRTFSALLISQAWKMANKAYPIILYSANGCVPNPISELDDDVPGSCIESGITSWLAGYIGEACQQIGGVQVPCTRGVFKKLPGFDELEKKTGITKDNIIASSWKAYKANDNKNGFVPTFDGIGAFRDGLETAGLYQIPICNIDDVVGAYRNTLGGSVCDYGGW